MKQNIIPALRGKHSPLSLFLGGMLLSGTCAAQDTGLDPHFGSVTLSSGFTPDPHVLELSAGGSFSASDADSACVGNIADAPDYSLHYEEGDYALSFVVDSGVDTTLLINDPDGRWHCNDDSEHLFNNNPGIRFGNPESGRYDIWVGVYDSSNNFEDATLFITEYGEENWSTLAPASGGTGNSAISAADAPYFGNDSSFWALDDQCDDPRFSGIGMGSTLLNYNRFRDASDCQALYDNGKVALQGDSLVTHSGSLQNSDPTLPDRGYYDTYRFSAVAGQRALISMTSNAVDTYLIVRSPGGEEFSNDDYGDTTRSLLELSLQETGDYEVIASSYAANETGTYSLEIDNAPLVEGIGLEAEFTGTLDRDGKVLTDGHYSRAYEFYAEAGMDTEIVLSSGDFDTYLSLYHPDGGIHNNDDMEGEGTNSGLLGVLPETGVYAALVHSLDTGVSGDFLLKVREFIPAPETGEIQYGSKHDN